MKVAGALLVLQSRVMLYLVSGGGKKISFIEKNWIKVNLDKKFTTRTGRINCSLLDKDNQWRWLGFQFVVDGN